jgi:hypothetical protein
MGTAETALIFLGPSSPSRLTAQIVPRLPRARVIAVFLSSGLNSLFLSPSARSMFLQDRHHDLHKGARNQIQGDSRWRL